MASLLLLLLLTALLMLASVTSSVLAVAVLKVHRHEIFEVINFEIFCSRLNVFGQ